MGARLRYIITPPTIITVNPKRRVSSNPCFQSPE
jgi:hypothetical protein